MALTLNYSDRKDGKTRLSDLGERNGHYTLTKTLNLYRWGFLPFNGGPRICLGQQFALTEIAYTTVRILQEFQRVEASDSSSWQEKWSLNCAVKSGCKVSLISEAYNKTNGSEN